jgi:PAS domain S-box-containing protein
MIDNEAGHSALRGSAYAELLSIDQSVLDAIPTAIYICSADGALVRFNRIAKQLWGRSPQLGDTEERFCGSDRLFQLDGTHLPHSETPMASVLRTGEAVHDREVVIERPDGSRVVVLVDIEPFKDRSGRVLGAINCFRDISELKAIQEDSLRRVRGQAALYHLTDKLSRVRSIDEVYEAALDAIIGGLKCRRASVLFFDELGVMRFVAWRGLSDGYRQAVEGHSPWKKGDRAAEPIHMAHVDEADLPQDLKDMIRAEGIGALAFVPLMAGGQVVGKFMAYHDAAHAFGAEEIDLALTIGRQMIFGMERLRTEEALRANEQRERARATELEAIMEAVPAIIWVARDPECRMMTGNRASYGFLRLSPDANVSLSAPLPERPTHFEILAGGRVLAPEQLPMQRAARGEEINNFEAEHRFSDGTSRHLLGNATPLRDERGQPYGAVAAFVDITERKQAEQHRTLLINELNHRVKNTLATVQAIAAQTLRRAQVDPAVQELFEARLMALASAHDILTRQNWESADLRDLLIEALRPYGDGKRVHLTGPAVRLTPKRAVALAIGIHELAANAVKHGALSNAVGQVAVKWQIDTLEPETLLLEWQESGGPQINSPTRQGFGSRMIERNLARDLDGEVTLSYEPDGVVCRISTRLRMEES